LDELKTIRKYYPEIPLSELLQWSTINGARVLQMDDTLGSFDPGRKPGVLLLENADNNITEKTTVTRLL